MENNRGASAVGWPDAHTVAVCDDALAKFFRHKSNPQDADDLKQQVWRALLEKPRDVVRADLRSYLFGIARFVLFRYFREKRGRAYDPLTTSMFELNPRLVIEATEVLGAQSFQSILMQLPIDDQVLLELRYVQGLEIRELAAVFEIPPGTIKSRLHTARARVRELLAGGR